MTGDGIDKDYGLVFDADAIRGKGGLTLTRPLDPAIFAGLFKAPDEVSEARLTLVFSVAGGSLLLQASVKACLRLGCARCGEVYTAEFSEAFDEVYEDTVKLIDVRGPLKEAAALMMPLKPLCAPDCRGLCRACGGNLNRKACGCVIEFGPFRSGAKDGGPFRALKDFPVARTDGEKRSHKPEKKRGK